MKVGDYCYIKGISRDYGIGKITQLNSGYSSNGGELIDIQFRYSKHSVPKINVVSSSNIIDLIEVGDYVNGSKVVDIAHAPTKTIYTEQKEACALIPITKDKLKSILTKEQSESMEYKL